MTSFQHFIHRCLLVEGGNAGERLFFKAETKEEERKTLVTLLLEFFNELNKQFEKHYHQPLFNKQDDIIKHFSGSSRHFMDLNVLDYPKNNLGDVDIMIDRSLRVPLYDFLTSLEDKEIVSGIKFSHFHSHQASEKSQYITVWDVSFNDNSIKLQIDFEFVDVDGKGIPTEWSQFSHSSHLTDLQRGIKGSFHKLLIRALTRKNVSWKILQKKKEFDEKSHQQRFLGKEVKETPEQEGWEQFYSQKSKTHELKLPENPFSFSVDSGLRPSLLSKKDSSGQWVHLNISSKDIEELSTNEKTLNKFLTFINAEQQDTVSEQELKDFLKYEKDLIHIIKTLFSSSIENDLKNKEKLVDILERFSSFVGLVTLINQYLTQEEKENIIYHFAELLWGWSFYKTTKKGVYEKGDKKLMGQELFINPSEKEIEEDSHIKRLAFEYLLSKDEIETEFEPSTIQQTISRNFYNKRLMELIDPLIETYKELYTKKKKDSL